MRYRLSYEIVGDEEVAKRIDVCKVWEIIDRMEQPIPKIMHLLYGEKGESNPITLKQVSRELNIKYGGVFSRRDKALRHLRYPHVRRQYLTQESSEVIDLKNFSTRELLNELIRRENR